MNANALIHYFVAPGILVGMLASGCRAPRASAPAPESIRSVRLAARVGYVRGSIDHRPWRVVITSDGVWDQVISGRMIDSRSRRTQRFDETHALLSAMLEHNLLSIPAGSYGVRSADEPTAIIEIRSDRGVKRYEVGCVANIPEDHEAELAGAVVIMRTWCAVIPRLSLPTHAETFMPRFGDMLAALSTDFPSCSSRKP